MRTDVYEKITNQIVAALETGVRPWHQPWNAEHSAGRITRRPYNVFQSAVTGIQFTIRVIPESACQVDNTVIDD